MKVILTIFVLTAFSTNAQATYIVTEDGSFVDNTAIISSVQTDEFIAEMDSLSATTELMPAQPRPEFMNLSTIEDNTHLSVSH